MKKLLTFFAAMAFVCSLNAQLADNSIAPNFTATDLNGNVWTLYDILESGKPVIMDISATWCGPCWSYHQTHALEAAWEQYGPDGTDELVVLFVEGDPSTNLACLTSATGCNSTTQGDWVTGTTNPIIDDATISDLYDLAYYPTVYLMCTNHLVREIGQLGTAQLYAAAQACPEPAAGVKMDALKFGTNYEYGKICGTQATTPSMLVLNSGSDTINSIKAELKVNGNLVQTLNYTTPIPSFFPREIEFAPINMTGNTILKMTVTAINGAAPVTAITKQVSYSKAKTTLTKELTLELKTDGYGKETYWELLDDQGNVYAAGGNENVGPNGGGAFADVPVGPGAYGNSTTYTETMEVPATGCYFLHMVDAYGDGMCTQGGVTGSYKLFESNTPTNVLTSGGCDFADVFGIFGAEGIVGVNDLLNAGSLRLAPNPANDQIRVDFSLLTAADVQITVTNALGQVVRNLTGTTYPAGSNSTVVELNDLNNGVYFLNLQTTEGSVARKFTVQH